jgi:hypothetical protein
MTAHPNPTIYRQVVDISHTYLGPAAERFIDRQIRNHLNKNPDQLQPSDIYKLIDWIRIAVSFLTEDSELIEAYTRQLQQLADKSKRSI